MMFWWLSLGIILPVITGFLLVSCWWSELRTGHAAFWCKLWVAVGVGLGVSSFTLFFTLFVAGSASFAVMFSTEILILVTLLGIRGSVNKECISPSARDSEIPTPPSSQADSGLTDSGLMGNTLSQILAIAFWVALIFAIGMLILRSLENPHGEPDAWTCWNSRARLFFRSGANWRNAFGGGNWAFPSYPLLTPMNIVRLWVYIGKETLIGPAIIAFLFTCATVGLLVSALAILRGRTQAFIGGLILSSTPYFIKHGAAQYADVPFGFYVLSTLVLLNFQDELAETPYKLWGLVGIVVGFAAWTKNEGGLLLVSVIIARVLTILIFKGQSIPSRRELWSFFMGIVPILVFLGYFRLAVASHHSFPSSAQGLSPLIERFTDFSRYFQTGKVFLRQIIEPYSLVYSTPIALFFVYAIFLGLQVRQLKKVGLISSLLTLGLMGGSYFFVFIVIPTDLTLLLTTSLSRLFLQLWPGMVFVFLMIIANPEERRNFYGVNT